MSSDTLWDPEKYRGRGESDEHWELKKHFMETHKDKFPEARLVCLAQVFTNMEFLGCRYNTEVMETVSELSKGVADSYREKKKDKLKRTFVKASDAAEARHSK